MKTRVVVGLFLLAQCADVARAQLKTPDQFYSNGEKNDAYTHDAAQKLKFTFWFAKKAPEDLIYRQEVVIVYDSEPDKAYYFDQKTRTFRGRWNFETEKYSLLPSGSQRSKKEEITESMFPPPADPPSIADLLRDPEEARPADRRKLAEPPATDAFPELEGSAWESTYVTLGATRVRARIQFDGPNGKYTLAGTGEVRTLSGVRYTKAAGGGWVISGQWSVKGEAGPFLFKIAPGRLNTFEGIWGGAQGQLGGTWDGTRLRD